MMNADVYKTGEPAPVTGLYRVVNLAPADAPLRGPLQVRDIRLAEGEPFPPHAVNSSGAWWALRAAA